MSTVMPASTAAPEGAPTASMNYMMPEIKTLDTTRYLSMEALPDQEEAPKKKKKKKLTKAQRREIKRLKEIENKKLELRDRLQRELALSRESAKRGRESWEDMCKEIKILEMREELQEWSVKTNRILEQKDAKILSMIEDMKTTQEMQDRLFVRHVQLMNHITSIYQELKLAAKNIYDSQAHSVIVDFYSELNAKEKYFADMKLAVERGDHSINMVVERRMFNDYQVHLERTDDNVNREIERRYRIRDSVLEKMENVRDQLFEFVHNILYSSLDVHKYDTIRNLMERQRIFVVESQKLNNVEVRGMRQMSDLQRDLLHIEVEMQRKMNDLRLELAYFLQVRKSIENNMERDRQITFQKLKISTSESYKVLKLFQNMEKRGELLLCLAATCRKLQTEKEKVTEFGDLMMHREIPDVEEIAQLTAINVTKHLDINEKDLQYQFSLMRNFWRRLAMVETENFLLEQEKRELRKENLKYIEFIKSLSKADEINHILEGITIKHLTCVPPSPCGGQTQKAPSKKKRKSRL